MIRMSRFTSQPLRHKAPKPCFGACFLCSCVQLIFCVICDIITVRLCFAVLIIHEQQYRNETDDFLKIYPNSNQQHSQSNHQNIEHPEETPYHFVMLQMSNCGTFCQFLYIFCIGIGFFRKHFFETPCATRLFEELQTKFLETHHKGCKSPFNRRP